jgi:dipeptidyl-peptidase-4
MILLKRIELTLLLLATTHLLPAQHFIPPAPNRMLTMEEAVLKQKTTLAPEKLKALNWVPGTGGLMYLKNGDFRNYTSWNPPVSTSYASNFFTLTDLNTALLKNQYDTLKSLPAINWFGTDQFSFFSGAWKMVYTVTSKSISKALTVHFPKNFENAEDAPGGIWTAFTIGNNLFVSNAKEELPVTHDSDKNIINGKSVHREEFGITKGTFWSPNGDLLAFYRMDQTMVTDYPVIDLTKRPAAVTLIKYPMAGDKSHEVTVGIFDPVKKTSLFLKTGEPREQYLTNIAWSPDQKHVYIAVLNRDQNHLWLNSYSSTTGDFEKTLFEEKDEKYVQPLHPIVFVRGHSDQFVWQSKRNGFNNIYLYDVSGKLIRQLTGKDEIDQEVEDFAGFDETGDHMLYQCSPKNDLIDRIIRSSSVKDGSCKTLTPLSGTHAINLSPDGKYFVDTYSSLSTPRVVTVYSSAGKAMATLLKAENPLKEFKLGRLRVFTIKAGDGTDLYCRMILPVDFDSTKKYPVIEYLYGGPGVQLITDSWLAGSDLWYQYMAEHGYLVFTLENRGSAGRGEKFEKATFRHLGTAEMEDQLKGVDYLISLSYVDQNRLGVMGWSFGGFMTTSLMTRHPGVFKVAVAGGPVIDWSYYEVMYTERYMDTPQTNKEGFAESSLLNYADKLKGKLLMIHGTSDDVVVWQHSLLFQQKCVDSGTQPDYFVYPGHLHNVVGKDRVHLFNKISEYFIQNL